jgi:hypothetical protein
MMGKVPAITQSEFRLNILKASGLDPGVLGSELRKSFQTISDLMQSNNEEMRLKASQNMNKFIQDIFTPRSSAPLVQINQNKDTALPNWYKPQKDQEAIDIEVEPD